MNTRLTLGAKLAYHHGLGMKGKAVKKFMSPTTPPMLPIIPRDEIYGTNILEIIKKGN